MGAGVVLLSEPGVEGRAPFLSAGVEPAVRPFPEERLDESLGLAFGLGPEAARLLVPGPEHLQGVVELPCVRVAEAAIGHHAFDPNALGCEETADAEQEASCGATPFVFVDLGVSDSGAVVHRDVDVLVTEPPAALSAVNNVSRDYT